MFCLFITVHSGAHKKWPKNTKNAFFACFWAYVRQPHGHIDWATSMPFASINSTNPRTNPWNFHKKYWELAILKNIGFLSRPFWILFFKKKIQNGRFFEMAVFQNRQFSKIFCENFKDWFLQYWVLGLVGLIDAKGIDVAQSIIIWPWGCPT